MPQQDVQISGSQLPESEASDACTVRIPEAGGAFIEGVVGAPQYLNPLLSDNFPVDRDLNSLIFDGLTRYGKSGKLEPALAESWSVSEDGLTVTFTLKDDVLWHDGEPVTAADVAFTYGLLQADDYPGATAVRDLWQSVTIQQLDEHTISFTLPELYSPFLDATTRGILPAHLLEGETAVSLQTSPFNKAPIGTGPFMVDAENDWMENGRLRLLPNPAIWPEDTKIAALVFQFFPNEETMLQAFMEGGIHAVNRVSDTALPVLAAFPNTRLFTAPDSRYTILLFNMETAPSELLQWKTGRQALANALDRPALVDTVLNGQGLPLEGPYLPSSWAYNPGLLTGYRFDLATAASQLDETGWTLTDGATVRQKDGTPLLLNLLALDTPQTRALAEAIGQQWSRAGIDTQITLAATTTDLRQRLDEGEFDAALVDFAPPGDPDLYDFWSQEAIIRGSNVAGWNNRKASEALEVGRQTWPTAERRLSYDTFQRQYNQSLPALTIYQHIYTYALSPEVNQAEIGFISNTRDRYQSLAHWFLQYRDVEVDCLPDANGS
ncbi:MAG: peptide ABC transporter substrate-binding protein [Anaerolineae bacterium]|nr:peptide ABC transporter substrate-binding protein [Anaerolineae bacterium]